MIGSRSFAMFLSGAVAPWQGLSALLHKRRLFLLALAPAAISVLLFVLGVFWAVKCLPSVIDAFLLDFVASRAGAHAWAYFGALALAWPAFLAGLAFAVFFAARILSGPFNSVLAATAFGIFSEGQSEVFGFIRQVRLRASAASVVEELAIAVSGGILFIFSFVPGIGVIAGALYFFLAAIDCVSYTFDVKGMGVRERLSYVNSKAPMLVGFATSLAAILLIPGVDFFIYPIGVAGGAWLIARDQGARKVETR